MLMVQVQFTRPADRIDTNLLKLVWVDSSWNLKVGDIVSFKDETELWNVDKVYDTKIAACNLEKKWGLDLPKSQRTER
jgi:hypothetical protein